MAPVACGGSGGTCARRRVLVRAYDPPRGRPRGRRLLPGRPGACGDDATESSTTPASIEAIVIPRSRRELRRGRSWRCTCWQRTATSARSRCGTWKPELVLRSSTSTIACWSSSSEPWRGPTRAHGRVPHRSGKPSDSRRDAQSSLPCSGVPGLIWRLDAPPCSRPHRTRATVSETIAECGRCPRSRALARTVVIWPMQAARRVRGRAYGARQL